MGTGRTADLLLEWCNCWRRGCPQGGTNEFSHLQFQCNLFLFIYTVVFIPFCLLVVIVYRYWFDIFCLYVMKPLPNGFYGNQDRLQPQCVQVRCVAVVSQCADSAVLCILYESSAVC